MNWRIGEILIQKKLIDWKQLEEALEEHYRTKELTGEILVRKGHISRSLLYKALGEQYHLRFVHLDRIRINPQAVQLIPRSIAQKYTIMPIEVYNGVLQLGIANPISAWPESEIKEIARVNEVRSVLCLPSDIERAIQENYLSQTV